MDRTLPVDNLPASTRAVYAQQLADEAKTLVPSMERLGAIATELRTDDLYRLLGFDTWERFCADYLGVAKSTANRWIVASSTVKPKAVTTGKKDAPAQNAPVVESPVLKIPATSSGVAKSSKGVASAGETLPTPQSGFPSDQPPEVPGSPDPAIQPPTNPPEVEDLPPPVPTMKSQVAHLIDHLQDLDPAMDGQLEVLRAWVRQGIPADEADVIRWMKAKSDHQVRAIGDPFGPAIRAEVQRWSHAFGFDHPARRQGTISRPEDRRKAKLVDPNPTMPSPLAVDPHNCTHPKDQKKTLPYGNFCGRCNTRIP